MERLDAMAGLSFFGFSNGEWAPSLRQSDWRSYWPACGCVFTSEQPDAEGVAVLRWGTLDPSLWGVAGFQFRKRLRQHTQLQLLWRRQPVSVGETNEQHM